MYATWDALLLGNDRLCTIESTDKWSHVITIDMSTVLGTSLVKNVTYNSNVIVSTSNLALSSFLYSQNVIEFSSLTNSLVTFELSGLPVHYRLFMHVKAYTACTIENTSLIITLDSISESHIIALSQ